MSIMKDACIVIPIYNEHPCEDEVISLLRNILILSEYDIYAICPSSMDTSFYREIGINNFVVFDDKYFKSNKSYSRLMLSQDFYNSFEEYEYMLIAQTDTYILNQEHTISDFICKGYDYWGAPWPEGPLDKPYGLKGFFKSFFIGNPEKLHVGNGGFSLRKVDTTSSLVNKYSFYIKFFWRLNEDLFFSVCAKRGICVTDRMGEKHIYSAATPEEASVFALETNMSAYLIEGKIPFAVHAWKKYLSEDIRNYEK